MILGKPGAGKTTFLQHIVIECNNGNLLIDKVPILIKLRDFVRTAKNTGDFSLERHVASYLRGCERSQVIALLESGKLLLLLDGLDEFPGADSDVVVDEIRYLIEKYPQNPLIINCRIQAQKYRFERFVYVEIADFNSEQIKTFSCKYFLATAEQQEGDAKAQQFMQKLNLPENKSIRELAVTPILLSLTCKVFGDTGKFYSKRHELYKEGLELLLSKWDESRGIKRDNVYRELSVKRKQELLSYMAAKKFEQEQYVLFTQEEIQGYISEYLGVPLEESQTVLEAIETQYGLLVERAKRIYSFSHLTFQEYFAARWFVNDNNWEGLVIHTGRPRWQPVILLVIGMIDNADDLLILISQDINRFLALYNNKNMLHFISSIAYNLSLFCKNTEIPSSLAFTIQFPFLSDVIYSQSANTSIRKTLTDKFNRFIRVRNIAINLTFFLLYPFITFTHIFDFKKKRPKTLKPCKTIKDFNKWWKANGKNWIENLKEIGKYPPAINASFNFNDLLNLEIYYKDNKFLLECLNSGCAVSDEVKKDIEQNSLFLIAETHWINNVKMHNSALANLNISNDRYNLYNDLNGLKKIFLKHDSNSARAFESLLSIWKKTSFHLLLGGDYTDYYRCAYIVKDCIECLSINEINTLAKLLNELGCTWMERGYFLEAKQHFEESLRKFQSIDDVDGQCQSLRYLGVLHHQQQRLGSALQYGVKPRYT